eukprot:1326341-Amphidinium_carterae.1
MLELSQAEDMTSMKSAKFSRRVVGGVRSKLDCRLAQNPCRPTCVFQNELQVRNRYTVADFKFGRLLKDDYVTDFQ